LVWRKTIFIASKRLSTISDIKRENSSIIINTIEKIKRAVLINKLTGESYLSKTNLKV
jgi:hypothetical protein